MSKYFYLFICQFKRGRLGLFEYMSMLTELPVQTVTEVFNRHPRSTWFNITNPALEELNEMMQRRQDWDNQGL